MNKRIILPLQSRRKTVLPDKILCGSNLVIGTTAGMLKEKNEDSIGCYINKGIMRICIADGHWGSETSQLIVRHWLKRKPFFPNSREEAIKETKKLEKKIFKIFGKPQMDPNKDFTAEASFIAIKISGNILSIVAYGDCRMIIANKGRINFCLKTSDTWLGAFSYLHLRKRLSVNDGLIFKKIKLVKDDLIFLFTDGVDQCIYEKDTISFDFIAAQSKLTDLNKIFNRVMEEVFANGAQDNASLAIIKF